MRHVPLALLLLGCPPPASTPTTWMGHPGPEVVGYEPWGLWPGCTPVPAPEGGWCRHTELLCPSAATGPDPFVRSCVEVANVGTAQTIRYELAPGGRAQVEADLLQQGARLLHGSATTTPAIYEWPGTSLLVTVGDKEVLVNDWRALEAAR